MEGMAYPEGLEPPTSWSVAKRSIRLSYGYADALDAERNSSKCPPGESNSILARLTARLGKSLRAAAVAVVRRAVLRVQSRRLGAYNDGRGEPGANAGQEIRL